MRAAEYFWQGKLEAFQTCIDKLEPPVLNLSEAISKATVRTGRYREGVAWSAKVLNNPKVQIVSHEYAFWKTNMEIEVVAQESAKRVEQELARVKEAVWSFRETTKNDLSSLKAASDRVQTETMKMSKQYKEAVDILTSPQFFQAIENAERLATALTAIQNLNQTKLSFAVFGEQPHDEWRGREGDRA